MTHVVRTFYVQSTERWTLMLLSRLHFDRQGSTNGTILNGKKMKKGTAYPVQVGSSLIFGDKNLASYKVSEEPDEGGDGAAGDAGSDPVGSE